MTKPALAARFTLREWSHLRVPVLIWLVVSVLASVAGPFGTLEAMGPVVRTLYWTGTAGIAIGLSLVAERLTKDAGRGRLFGVWALFVLVLATGSHLVNSVMFEHWGGWRDWAYLAATVGITTTAVHLLIWGLRTRIPAPTAKAQDDTFQRRLPIAVRGPLIRIEAQDHYLNVVTQNGQDLILMRLGDAMAELEGKGLQVHRSHWISVQGVSAHRRDKGRDVLVMSDGAQVPVSRSFRTRAQEAGLF